MRGGHFYPIVPRIPGIDVHPPRPALRKDLRPTKPRPPIPIGSLVVVTAGLYSRLIGQQARVLSYDTTEALLNTEHKQRRTPRPTYVVEFSDGFRGVVAPGEIEAVAA